MRGKTFVRESYRYLIATVAVAVIMLIAFYNAKMTSYFVRWKVTYYVGDSIFVNLLAAGGIVFALLLLGRSRPYRMLADKMADDRFFFKVKRILLLVIFAQAVFWAVSTQFIPGTDEWGICEDVYNFMRKDYSTFAPGGGLCRSADNRGLFLFECCVSAVFGNRNYLVYELINAFAVAVVYKQFSEILGRYQYNRIVQLSVIGVGVLFFPLTGYSIMVYGNLIGMALGVTAIKYELMFFEKFEWRQACRSAVFITLAALMKSNMLIYLIAVVLSALLKVILSREKKVLCFILILALGYEVQATVPDRILENITGYELEPPYSYWSFIAMGLKEADCAPGWWNGYIHTNYWDDSGNVRDVRQQAESAKESIKDSIYQFSNDHEYAFSFFTKKIASMWANPTFECFATARRGSHIEAPAWVSILLSDLGQYWFDVFFNLLEFMILAGAVLELLIAFRERDYIDQLIFPMILVGGFFFHLFWEAKARYALLYFVVLIPYAVMGYADLVRGLRVLGAASAGTLARSVRMFCAGRIYLVALCGILLLCYGFCYSDNRGGKILTENTEAYAVYLGGEWNRVQSGVEK